MSRAVAGRDTIFKGWGTREEATARWRAVSAAHALTAESLKAAAATLKRRTYAHNPAKRIPWDAIAFLLGWYPDRHVAAVLGVVHSTVIWARRQRGWAAAHGRGRPPLWRDFAPFPGQHPRGWVPDLADRFQRAYATADDGEGLEAVAEEVRTFIQASAVAAPDRAPHSAPV